MKITADSLEGNHRLKAIVRAGVGTDNIDKEAATRLGIVVMNTPAGNTLSTAEHTIAMMLALSRNIAPAYQSLIEHKWDRNKYMGTQLADKTLGIVGLGRIGQAVAKRAKALQMRVLGYDPFLSSDRVQELGIEPVDVVRDMLPQVDYLTVHTPLTDETKGPDQPRRRSSLKPATVLGQLRPRRHLRRSGLGRRAQVGQARRRGARRVHHRALHQQPPVRHARRGLATPHLGASTEEAQAQVAVEGVGLLVDFLTTGAIRHAVNMSPLDRQNAGRTARVSRRGPSAGLAAGPDGKRVPSSCEVHYRGDVADKNTKLLSAAFACGLLENALDEEVNIVNAEVLLRERGIELVEQSRRDMGAFSSVISASITSDGESRRAAGTLFGHNMPRLVQIDDHRLEAYLDGVLMVFTHHDVPGIIGRVGTIFGEHGVNIAQMAVGRTRPGGAATGVLNLDALPPADAVNAVRSVTGINSAIVVSLPPAGKLPGWLQG